MNNYAKAIVAALVAGVGAIATGYADDSLTQGELWAAISTGLAAGAATFGIRNGSRPEPVEDDYDSEGYA